ncbi:MAG: hypothetical protein KGZ83_18890 [Sulfuricella sp.]|nr:hypothetical protein [Sulfuricella sp.]
MRPHQPKGYLLSGLPEALGAHLQRFSGFFVSRTRDATPVFYGYVRGLFQSERGNMLRMSEVNAVDHQAMQHMIYPRSGWTSRIVARRRQGTALPARAG